MATSSPFYFILLLSTILLFSIAVEANLEELCKAVAASSQNSQNPVNQTFCVTSLQPYYPKSATPSKPWLAGIMVRLSVVNATRSKAKIDMLNKKNTSSVIHGVLDSCSKLYADAIPNLINAMRAIGTRKYTDAVQVLNVPRDVGYNCDTIFFEGGRDNIVAKEGEDLTSLVVIAQEILTSFG